VRLTRRTALRGGGYGAGTFGGIVALGYGVIKAEASLARRTIGEPTELPPDARGCYGRYTGEPLRLVMIGDSGATGLGAGSASHTPGALLAGGVARDLKRRVVLDVVAFVGAKSADLAAQVEKALDNAGDYPIDLAVIMVGTNDVTHGIGPGPSARDLGLAVATLRNAGALVVVGTCPDLGAVKPLLQPLRTVASFLSRRLAAAQAVAVVENDGIAVTLGTLLSKEFSEHAHLWSADRFHPSPDGYRRVADAILPSLLEGMGVDIQVSVPVSSSIQDSHVAAHVAAREPGMTVESIPGEQGAAAAGPGRLVRVVRRLPVVGRGAPDVRSEGDAGHLPDQDAEG
jgi:lysophospholipase L1-like esterase